MSNMKEALKQNDMESFHEQEEMLKSSYVIRFLRKICELDRFSIYIFEDDEVIDQRVEYTEDMDIFPLVIRALDYDAPQNVEIYRR